MWRDVMFIFLKISVLILIVAVVVCFAFKGLCARLDLLESIFAHESENSVN